jgi:plastocyanin
LLVAVPALADDTQIVDVQLDSYRFVPDRIVVQVNRPVKLRAANVASFIPHSLVINAPQAGIDVNLAVRAGKTGEVTFMPTVPGTYEMICDKQPPIGPSHRDKGMHGVLVVEDAPVAVSP